MSSTSSEWTGLAAALVEHENYRPLKSLGKKAGRQTLLCEERATGQLVVIKLLSFGEDFAWQDLKLFEREAETLHSLDHPAIPKYLDHFELETPRAKGFALVQSYIEARSLQQQLEAGRSFSEAEIQQIGEELLGILSYLHGRQPPVIHRDIKPSNILLGDRSAHSPGQVYLVDFGSVQTLAAREGGTITVVGTYGYMPPEQFGGRAVPASDLYSLGATLIYLASGKHPADLPQKDFRIQFEDVVNLKSQTIAWLQLLVEPSLEHRAASTGVAFLECSQNSALLHSNTVIGDTRNRLLFKPASSTIEAARTPKGTLLLGIPADQIRLNVIGFHQKITFLARTIYGTGIGLLCFSLSFVFLHVSAYLVFSIMNMSWSSPFLAQVSWLLVWVTLLALFVLPFVRTTKMKIESFLYKWLSAFLWFAPRYILNILGVRSLANSSSKPVTLLIGKLGKIEIRYKNQKMQRFVNNKSWRLNRSSRLHLSMGPDELSFDGSDEELVWLEQILRDELGLF